MNTSRWKVIALAFAIFGFGVITGAGVARFLAMRTIHRFFDAPPEAARTRALLWILDRKLRLSHEQRDKIEVILESQAHKTDDVMGEVEPRMMQIRTDTYQQIRPLLSPDQQPEFDRLMERFERRHKRKFHQP